MNHLSCLLEHWLQQLKLFVLTFIQDSNHLLDLLKAIDTLPLDTKVFTANANSMYTNINTNHVIKVITLWLKSLNLPQNYPL